MITVSTISSLHKIPAIFTCFPTLIAAESTRHGGVSPAPFASLNLGINTADDPSNVNENRRRFFEAIGAQTSQFASSHQVHGTEILYATEAGRFEGYDALITDKPGLLIGVTVADCVPILIYDCEHQAVAAIHAGWRGTVGGIVRETLSSMQQQFGTSAEQCYAYVGTCIDECSFEVGPEVAEQFEPELKCVDVETGKGYIDLKRANTKQLTAFGIPPVQIGVSPFSTVLNNDEFFSYRAEQGQTGRMLAVIGVRN
ncbi:peptidoglycan editing factor PgeF [Spirosoma sp. HMF3257]|uniref:Purine nucleoside phosphorylase n=1 Tax=Spirosoma telluris TaxID=2183553 RepID=A0A327NMT3_9BACT|nr:peptidoglycan editing factor PgeF [Spirosoma telluris]RAI75214.1 peptidoglycan editing factor PgeF [Spirosoma telluris]